MTSPEEDSERLRRALRAIRSEVPSPDDILREDLARVKELEVKDQAWRDTKDIWIR